MLNNLWCPGNLNSDSTSATRCITQRVGVASLPLRIAQGKNEKLIAEISPTVKANDGCMGDKVSIVNREIACEMDAIRANQCR